MHGPQTRADQSSSSSPLTRRAVFRYRTSEFLPASADRPLTVTITDKANSSVLNAALDDRINSGPGQHVHLDEPENVEPVAVMVNVELYPLAITSYCPLERGIR